MWISSPGWRLFISTVVPLGEVVIFYAKHIVHGAWFNLLVQCFVWTVMVRWCHISFMKLLKGRSRKWWRSSHDMGCLFKELLSIGVVLRVMMSWYEEYCCSILSISIVINSNDPWYLYLTVLSTLIYFPVSVLIFNHMWLAPPYLLKESGYLRYY